MYRDKFAKLNISDHQVGGLEMLVVILALCGHIIKLTCFNLCFGMIHKHN